MEIKELGHVVFYVKDLKRSTHFYRDVLGFAAIETPERLRRLRAPHRAVPRRPARRAAGGTRLPRRVRPAGPRRDAGRGVEGGTAVAPPVRFLRVVLLADVEGYSYKEIASSLGIPLGTVMSRLHRGRQALRNTMLAYGERNGTV